MAVEIVPLRYSDNFVTRRAGNWHRATEIKLTLPLRFYLLPVWFSGWGSEGRKAPSVITLFKKGLVLP